MDRWRLGSAGGPTGWIPVRRSLHSRLIHDAAELAFHPGPPLSRNPLTMRPRPATTHRTLVSVPAQADTNDPSSSTTGTVRRPLLTSPASLAPRPCRAPVGWEWTTPRGRPARQVARRATYSAVGSMRLSRPRLQGSMIPISLAWFGVVASMLLICLAPTLAGFLHGSIVTLMWLPILAFAVPLGRWLLAVSPIGRGSSGNVCWLLRGARFNGNPPAGLGRAALESGVQAGTHRSHPVWRGHGRGAEPGAGHGAVGPPALEAPDGERAPGGCCGERGCRPH
jgi:hypothetical protein